MAPRKKSFHSGSISTRDWLHVKPYDRISNYDLKYISICNQLFRVFNEYLPFFRAAKLGKEEIRTLSVLVVSYFEDFINEIGIWAAFRSINRELFGYPIPFYDLSDYDEEFLNPEDIAFLIWSFCSTQADGLFHAPDRPDLLEMAQKACDLLDEKIGEVPDTDFYQKYFHYSSRPDFFELKEKLQWLALGSYFFGPIFTPDVFRELQAPSSDPLQEAFASDPGKLLYVVQENYIYERRLPLSAISAPEMLARLLDCPEEVRKDVLNFHRRPTALFYLKEKDDQYYHLQLPATGRIFRARKDSVGHGNVELESEHFHFASLIQWDGEWLFTGIVSTWPNKKGMMEELKTTPALTTHVYDTAHQEKAKESTRLMEKVFFEVFGGSFVICEDGKALTDALEKYNKAFHHKVAEKSEQAKQFQEKRPDFGPEKFDHEKYFPEARGIGLFFVPEQGIEMFSGAGDLAGLLQAKRELPRKEITKLFFGLMSDQLSADSTQVLLEAYSDRNLAFPFPASRVDIRRDWPFLLRFFKPNDFGEKRPNMSLVSSGNF